MSLDETWRTWLMTGARRPPIDRRRVRGAHQGLKRMLVEGMSNGGDRPHSWTRFSGAMVRQAVDDGVRALPPDETQLIKLAYFGGLSNAEIARRMGITVSSVERGLKQAVAKVSDYVERGRSAGRRAIYAALLFFGGRSLADSDHMTRAGSLAAVAAAAMLVAAPASPAQLTPVERAILPAVVSLERGTVVSPAVVSTQIAVTSRAFRTTEAADTLPVALPVALPMAVPLTSPVSLPATPVRLKTPPLPAPPVAHGLLGA
jgi:predicted DNA-binding protein (UPF0251 family)